MEFNKKDPTVIDENTDNFFVNKTATDLAHEAAIAAIPPVTQRLSVDQWIQSFSDCA